MPPPKGTHLVDTKSLDRNYLSAHTKWNTADGKIGAAAGSSWGVCFAMSAMWIRESLHGIGPVTAAAQLGQQKQRICICQGIYYQLCGRSGGEFRKLTMSGAQAAEMRLLQMLDLKVVGALRSDGGGVEPTPEELERYKQTTMVTGAYTLLGMGSSKEGHAVGMRIGMANGQESYYFDPNYGLYSYPNPRAMEKDAMQHFSATYGEPKHGRMYPVALD